MVHRKRKCCFFLLVVTFFSACAMLYPHELMRAAFTDYVTHTDGEKRRLLQQDTKLKAALSSESRVAKAVNDAKRSEREREKYRVPIFWDDGEFMEEDSEDIARSRETEAVRVATTIAKSDVSKKASNSTRPSVGKQTPKANVAAKPGQQDGAHKGTETQRTMAVLDYKLSQFQTVKYSNMTEPAKSQSGESDGAEEATSRILPAHLLIVTQRRSGSSFLGQIFNQNPWVFFHFEPLKLLEIKKNIYPTASALLENLLKCQFDRTPYLMDLYNNETLHRLSSQVLCSPPLCTTNVEYNKMDKTDMAKQCGRLDTEAVKAVCNVYPHKVVKLIRLYSVESLQPLLKDSDLNVKIIHLLRDPRGTLSSRAHEHKDSARSLTPGKRLDRDAAYVCRRMRHNFKFVREHQEFLKDRYLRVRYEDIAADPTGWTRALYRFAGMGDVPVNVFSWIQENTQASTKRDTEDTYSTHRNSSATAQAWRHHTDFPVVKGIQSFCQDVLQEAGYVAVKNEKDLHRDDLNLVAPVT